MTMTRQTSPTDLDPRQAEEFLAWALDGERSAPGSTVPTSLAAHPAALEQLRAHAEVGDALRSLEPSLGARRVGQRVAQALASEPIHFPQERSHRRAQATQARGFLRWGSLAAGVAAVAFLGLALTEFSSIDGPSSGVRVASSAGDSASLDVRPVQVSLSAPSASRYIQAHGNGAVWLRIGASEGINSPAQGNGGR